MPFEVKFLGRISYDKAHEEMIRLRDLRLENKIGDHVLVLEHDPVITSGRKQVDQDLLVSSDFLEQKKIQFKKTDRGGKLTYHGPGQLMVYFVFNIYERKMSVQDLVCKAEQGLIDLLKDYDLNAHRDSKNPGIWIEDAKIASLGFHIHRGITTHGICLNINPDLGIFDYFIPCGLSDRKITSLSDQLDFELDFDEISRKLIFKYQGIFG